SPRPNWGSSASLVVLASEGWKALAAQLGIDAMGPGALERSEVEEAVLQRLQARLGTFPSSVRVRRAWLTLEPWTVDEGL
ncbi:hypothetical protein OFD51_34645, partial [Escherichia coli]|nr:hypothetical protein [Escherichia coli]